MCRIPASGNARTVRAPTLPCLYWPENRESLRLLRSPRPACLTACCGHRRGPRSRGEPPELEPAAGTQWWRRLRSAARRVGAGPFPRLPTHTGERSGSIVSLQGEVCVLTTVLTRIHARSRRFVRGHSHLPIHCTVCCMASRSGAPPLRLQLS